jgi:hypothetical protein
MTTHASTSPNRFAEHVRTAIEAAPLRDLDGLASKLWAAHGAGIIGDDQAQELQETIQQRRRPQPVAQSLLSATPIVAPRYYIQRSPEQRSPDRAASIARRRRLALSGLMPPQLGDRFTVGELAVLKIVADEFLAHGVCDLSRNAGRGPVASTSRT